jgi:hypothetical protein
MKTGMETRNTAPANISQRSPNQDVVGEVVKSEAGSTKEVGEEGGVKEDKIIIIFLI